MPTYKKHANFFETEEGVEYIKRLKKMAIDSTFNTDSSYSANSEMYPDNLIPFVNKHIDYLRKHPSLDPHQYLANLRLMTRVR